MTDTLRFAANLDELGEGWRKSVEIGKRRFLLLRHGGNVVAIGAISPHAGGPLSESVLHGGRVICPCHKAAFEMETRKCTAPPSFFFHDGYAHAAAGMRRGREMAGNLTLMEDCRDWRVHDLPSQSRIPVC